MIPFGAKTVWVLFANRSQARIFSGSRAPESIHLIQSLENPTGDFKEQDFDADKPGRGSAKATEDRHAFTREVSATEKDAERFAKEVAETLSKARSNGDFDSIILAAEPRFLGNIRAQLDDQVSNLVCDEVPKDLIPLSPDAQLQQARDLVRSLG